MKCEQEIYHFLSWKEHSNLALLHCTMPSDIVVWIYDTLNNISAFDNFYKLYEGDFFGGRKIFWKSFKSFPKYAFAHQSELSGCFNEWKKE